MKVWVAENGLVQDPYGIARIELLICEGHLGNKDWAWCEETGRQMAIYDFLARADRSVHGD